MAGAILAGERLGWRLGKVEEVVGNFYAQGIEARRPEGGNRRERAAGNELSSALSEGRRKRELSEQIRMKKRLGLGLKTSNRSDRFGLPVRPVRRRGVTILPP